MSSDFKITKNGQYYDLTINSVGDIEAEDGWDTSLLISLFEERRADDSNVIDPTQARGWWGNTVAERGFPEVGSRNWLLSDARNDDNTLNLSNNYTRECLNWLQDLGYVKKIFVESEKTESNIQNTVTFVRFGDKTKTETFNLWENTGD